MPKRSPKVLVVGLILGSVPGSYRSQLHLLADASLLVGVLLIAVSTLRGEFGRPKSALVLIGYCNLAFWLTYVLWVIRVKALGPSPDIGISPFAGILAEWFALLVIFSAYELIVFTRATFANEQRTSALFGFGALVVQILTSVQFSYRLVQGV